MNELIINASEDRITVSARELHKALEISERFNSWMERNFNYGFQEGEDFVGCKEFNALARQELNDYQLTIDMAKQICMIQRSEKGRQYREYFLKVERDWNSPEKVMARALVMAEKKIKTLEIENKQMKPKALFADAVETSETAILVGDLAKLIRQNGKEIGQNRLFEWLRNEGFLIKSGSSKNMPTQRAMEMGLFEVKERTFSNPDGSVRITRTTKVTGKGQIYFINRFCG